jgi:hypothetical protein
LGPAVRGDQSGHPGSVPVAILSAIAASSGDGVCSRQQVVAEVGMGFHASVWHRDSNAIPSGNCMRLVYLQIAQMPLVASNPIDAAWLRCPL